MLVAVILLAPVVVLVAAASASRVRRVRRARHDLPVAMLDSTKTRR